MKKQRNRKRIPHRCPGCGQVRQLEPSAAVRTKLCRRCHCQQIAPLGFAATARTRGADFAIRAAARKRKRQPSTLEQQVEAALCEIGGIAWERECAVERDQLPPYFVDFAVWVGKRRVALEVNGDYIHRNDGPAYTLRIDTLRQCFDEVIVLTEQEIVTSADLSMVVRQLIALPDFRNGVK